LPKQSIQLKLYLTMMTTAARVYFIICMQFIIAFFGVSLANSADNTFAGFRHVDVGAVAPLETITSTVKLLTDNDFAPFSYVDGQGKLVGLSVEMARQACVLEHITCELVALPFVELVPKLLSGEGDAIISGLRTTPTLLEKITVTRPYYFSSARFIARLGTPFELPDVRTLAGRRIGYVKGTSHQAFLEKYYERSALTPFTSEAEMFEALRTGNLDAAFADTLHADYWMKGTNSRNCCANLGQAFYDRSSFSKGLTFQIRQDHESLRAHFDFALDQIEETGEAAKIMARYLPASPF
jgi:polar amino acid transport system substrate-binding protein